MSSAELSMLRDLDLTSRISLRPSEPPLVDVDDGPYDLRDAVEAGFMDVNQHAACSRRARR